MGCRGRCQDARRLARSPGPVAGRARWRHWAGPPVRFGRGERGPPPAVLDVEVESELVRMWPQPHRVHLVLALVVDPGLDQIRGEHLAPEQELVVLLEVIQNGVQRAGELLDLL